MATTTPTRLRPLATLVRTVGFQYLDDDGALCTVENYDPSFDSVDVFVDGFGDTYREVVHVVNLIDDGTYSLLSPVPTRRRRAYYSDADLASLVDASRFPTT